MPAQREVKFSLILATVDRVGELERFFSSLAAQTCSSFECVLVDQNCDDRLADLVGRYQSRFPLLHIRAERGLSHARNIGLRHAQGKIVAFPDDDCWYPDNVLENAASILDQHPEWDGITGIANSGTDAASVWRWDVAEGLIDRYNVWKRGISITLFLRRGALDRVGGFDEELGLGAKTSWLSGEETDVLIRAVGLGMKIAYRPDLVVHHPDAIPDYQKLDLTKVSAYAAGMGHILKKHHYPFAFVLRQLLWPLGGMAKSVLQRDLYRARYHLSVFAGRLRGWLHS